MDDDPLNDLRKPRPELVEHSNSFAELVAKVNAGDAGAINLLMGEWKAHKASTALEEYWNQVVPSGTTFDQADAVASVLAMLSRYEAVLRKIAEKGGPDAEIAKEALAYKPPVRR